MLRPLAFMLAFALLAMTLSGWLWRHRWPGLPPEALQAHRQQELARNATWRDVILADGPPARTAEDLLEAIKWQGGLNVFVSWTALELADLDSIFHKPLDEPIPTAGISAGDAMDRMLAQIDEPRVGWRWRDDVLTISTRDDLRDVAIQVVDAQDELVGSRVLSWLRRAFMDPDELHARQEAAVIASIMAEVDSDSWKSVGNIQSWRGNLVLRQSPDNLAAITDWYWTARVRALAIDLALIALPAALLGLVFSIPFSRRRRWRRLGRCVACGYDLRASPHQCPECGKAVLPHLTAHQAI